MIRPLRQLHRRGFIALGIFLPLALAVGIAARKSVSVAAELPPVLAAPQKFESVEWERSDLFPKSPVTVRLLREQKNTGPFAIGFSADKNFVKADLMVYWIQTNAQFTNALPNGAVLLGSFDSTALLLPDDFTKSAGRLALYSLAHGEIVDMSTPISFQRFSTSMP
jgi:hypothetical protein